MADSPPVNPNPSPQPEQRPNLGKSSIVSVAAAFSGPLPPPNVLSGYEDVLPGAADRIISMAEKQSEHRQELERLGTAASIDAMKRQFQEARCGQICAVIVALALIGGGVYLAKIGHPWEGTAMGGGGVIGGVGLQALVGTFLKGRSDDSKPEESKPRPKQKKKR